MTSTSIEKSGAADLVQAGETAEARRLNALYKQCTQLAKSELVPKALRGKPDNVFALALYGEQYDLSAVHAVQRIYIIEGTFDPKADVVQGVIMRAGHEVSWDEISDTICRVSIRRAGSDRWQPFSYTIEQARKAGALDVWVEHKVKNPGDDWAKRETYVIGNDLGIDPEKVKNAPAWAKALIEAGTTRRKDPWWSHPDDMLAAKAIKRAGRRACPDVLLGLNDDDPFEPLTPQKVLASTTDPAPRPEPEPDEVTPQAPEAEIEDAEIVETPAIPDEPEFDVDQEPEQDPAAAHVAAIKRLMVTCTKAFPETDAPKGKKTHRQRLLRRAAQFAVVREHRSANDLTAVELQAVESWVYRHFVDEGATVRMTYEILDGDVVRFTLGDKSKDIAPAAEQPAAA